MNGSLLNQYRDALAFNQGMPKPTLFFHVHFIFLVYIKLKAEAG